MREWGHFLIIKGYIYISGRINTQWMASKILKQLLPDLRNSSTIVGGDFRTSLSTLEKLSRLKLNKYILDLKEEMKEKLADIGR